jgi:hypothetical protein
MVELFTMQLRFPFAYVAFHHAKNERKLLFYILIFDLTKIGQLIKYFLSNILLIYVKGLSKFSLLFIMFLFEKITDRSNYGATRVGLYNKINVILNLLSRHRLVLHGNLHTIVPWSCVITIHVYIHQQDLDLTIDHATMSFIVHAVVCVQLWSLATIKLVKTSLCKMSKFFFGDTLFMY